MGLKSKAVSAVKWTSAYTIILSFLGPIYKIILTRFLTPHDFSYIAVLALFITLSKLINNIGIGESVIQKKDVTHIQLTNIFIFNVIISIIITLLLFLASGFIEDFYNYEQLSFFLKVICISVFFNGISSLFRIYLQKNLLFKYFSIANIARIITDILVTLGLLILGFGLFGYVIGTIVSSILFSILLFVFCKKYTDLKFQKKISLKIVIPFIKFGMFISLKQFLTFISRHIDEIFIGKFLSPEILGLYFFAKDFMYKPQTLITQAFSKVLFSLFSKVQDNMDRLKKVYNTISHKIAFIAFPVFIGLALTANLFVPAFFSEKWWDSVFLIQIFAVTGVFFVLTANVSTSLLYAVNKPDKVLYIDIATFCLYFLSIIVVGKNNFITILICYVSYMFIKIILLQIYANYNLKNSVLNYLKQLKNPFICVILMTISLLGIQMLLSKINVYILLSINIILGICIYFGSMLIIDRKAFLEIIELLRNRGSHGNRN